MHRPECPDKVFDPFAELTIRKEAYRVLRASRMRIDEIEDLKQELRMHLLRQSCYYDGARGCWTTFTKTVVSRKATTILLAERAQRRDRRREGPSLDEVGRGGECTARVGGLAGAEGKLTRTRAVQASWEERTNLRVDVERALLGLLPASRVVATLLMDQRVAEVARCLDIPRSTLYGQIAHIRDHFLSHGLGVYLG